MDVLLPEPYRVTPRTVLEFDMLIPAQEEDTCKRRTLSLSGGDGESGTPLPRFQLTGPESGAVAGADVAEFGYHTEGEWQKVVIPVGMTPSFLGEVLESMTVHQECDTEPAESTGADSEESANDDGAEWVKFFSCNNSTSVDRVLFPPEDVSWKLHRVSHPPAVSQAMANAG